MKTLTAILTLTVALCAWSFGSLAYISSAPPATPVVSAQDECKDGETWNEETKQCEKSGSGN